MAILISQTSNCLCLPKKEHKQYNRRLQCLAKHDKAKTSPVLRWWRM